MAHVHVPVSLFSGIHESSLTIILDISASMYNSLSIVRDQIIAYLTNESLASDLNIKRLFNLIAFSSECYPWADSMVLWNDATCANAIAWLRALETKTGTNTLDALLIGLEDSACGAVLLITDDISDQDPYALLAQVGPRIRGRPVHCVYVTSERGEDPAAVQLLQSLASMTKGTFKIVAVGRYGIERITPLSYDPAGTIAGSTAATTSTFIVNTSTNLCPVVAPPHQFECSTQFLQSAPMAPLFTPKYSYPSCLSEPACYTYPCLPVFPKVMLVDPSAHIPCSGIAWSRFRPVCIQTDGCVVALSGGSASRNDIAYTPDAGSLLLNRNVLARSNSDGYYYKGTVRSQVLAHRFMIEFGPNVHGKWHDTSYQNTAIYDIIHYDDAAANSIHVGDKVLAKMDAASDRFAPGEVIEGEETRGDYYVNRSNDKPLVVKFPNGKTRTLERNDAVWLPNVMYERIRFELNLPSTSRQYLEEASEGYPCQPLPGYPASKAYASVGASGVVMPRLIYDIWPYYVPHYPLHATSLTTSSCNLVCPEAVSGSTTTTTLTTCLPPSGIAISERPLRRQASAVEASSINERVIGSALTTNQLDEKVKKQIYNHRHLLPDATETKRSCCSSVAETSCSHVRSPPPVCTCCRPSSQPAIEDQLREEQRKFEIYTNKLRSKTSEHERAITDSSVNSCDCKHRDRSCSQHRHEHGEHKPRSLSRSKSVVFSSHEDHHHNQDDDKYDHYYYEEDSRSWLGDYLHERSGSPHDKHRHSAFDDCPPIRTRKLNIGKVPDRFGNPNVSVGMPDRPGIKMVRAHSASGKLDNTITSHTFVDLNENPRRMFVANREKARLAQVAADQQKQDQRDEYHRAMSRKNRNWERQREDDALSRSISINLARKENNAVYAKRFESNKIDFEKQEQMKYDALREQVNRRNIDHYNNILEQDVKEANRVAFKQSVNQMNNQKYHDRLLAEDRWRKDFQARAMNDYNKNKKREVVREKREQKIADHTESMQKYNLLKAQHGFMKH